jgi:hypothetical protein
MSARSDLIAVATGLNRPGVLPKGWSAILKRSEVHVVRHWTCTEIVITPTSARANNLPGWAPKRPALKKDWAAKMIEEVAEVAAFLEMGN